MKYKLVDVKHVHEDDVQFGTCDLCRRLGTIDYDTLVFEDELGREHEVDTGRWSYWDFENHIDIDNYLTFSEFISTRDYAAPSDDEYGNLTIDNSVREMIQDYEDREGVM